jgi:hypothetical protein
MMWIRKKMREEMERKVEKGVERRCIGVWKRVYEKERKVKG